jgi:hypothetical protein
MDSSSSSTLIVQLNPIVPRNRDLGSEVTYW